MEELNMNISDFKGAEWVPEEHRLAYEFSGTEFWSFLMFSIFFACLTPIMFIFGMEMDDMAPGITSLILAIILALFASNANKKRGFKTVLNRDGICSYRHDEIIRLVKYQEIAYIEQSTKAPDENKIYYSYTAGPAVRLRHKTLDLYNDKNELLTRLTLEPTVELVLVLLMLINHNPNLESSLSIADEKDIKKYVESRKSTYERLKKNDDKSKNKGR